MLLQKSMNRLAANSGAEQLRLWGQVRGVTRDYYIVEGKSDAGGDDDDRPADVEPRGTGVNTFCYWVCTSPASANWE